MEHDPKLIPPGRARGSSHSCHLLVAGGSMPGYVRMVAEAARTAQLAPVKLAAGTSAQEPVLLISVVRDERPILPEFLAHYRRLEVGRFIMIDNGSADGSAEFLAAQPDVDLYSSRQSFRWPRKQAWINRIIARYGYDRWYFYADADEYLVFDGAKERPLAALAAYAERRGLRRVRGMLVDMYGAVPLPAPAPPGALGERFPYFDGDSYSERLILSRISRTGGPRARAFSGAIPFRPELSKYPLFNIRAGEVFHSPHYLFPYRDNYLSPCFIALLHYKFTDGFIAKAQRAILEASYWQDSLEYRRYLERLASGGVRLVYPGTREYHGPADLVRAGLIEPIPWPCRLGRLWGKFRAAAGQNHRAGDIRPSPTSWVEVS
jgi:Glycosyl transferase family 2